MLRQQSPLPQTVIAQTQQQLARLDKLPPGWNIAYSRQLLEQAQSLWPEQTKPLVQQWQRQLNSASILNEGIDEGVARHKLHGDALRIGIEAMGLEVFGDPMHKMNNVLGINIPNRLHDLQIRECMLNDFGIEIGTSFGPLKGKMWRIGTMGYNARKDCVLQTLAALEATINRFGFKTVQGKSLEAAWDSYGKGLASNTV
ncbi:(S)-ureidoglycine--glyoxylate transaminase [Serratia plymuthica]|uniref:VasL domain-containing protein n=1 Tax=Serratia plymuthica TaxID=82996 RepID=UPI00034D2F3A|nr:VasL domain-containing protein [Serratia plymuthica]QJW56470.1 (S)-ureidoglycine--glyoxylate transaminase [Serratia plymuthica]